MTPADRPQSDLKLTQSKPGPHSRAIFESLLNHSGAGFFGHLIFCVSVCPVLLFLGVFVSLVFLFLGISLVFLSVFCLFTGFSRVRMVRKILGVFEVFLGVFEKTKEKKDRVVRSTSTSQC